MAVEGESKLQAYYQAWAGSLASLLSQLSSMGWQVEPVPDSGDYEPILQVAAKVMGGLEGQQWVGFSEADVSGLLNISQQPSSSAVEDASPERRRSYRQIWFSNGLTLLPRL